MQGRLQNMMTSGPPRPPNSALFYFDREHRQAILQQHSQSITSAEQAYALIKKAFEESKDAERYETMAREDVKRFHSEGEDKERVKEEVRREIADVRDRLKSIEDRVRDEGQR